MLKNSFIITEEQIEQLTPYLPDIENLVRNGLGDFLLTLNDVIIDNFDDDYGSTEISDKLQKIYDEIYNQN